MPDIQRITIVKNYFNLSQKDFSFRIGISPSKLSKAESGNQKISAEMIFAIHKEFNISIEWLMGKVGDDKHIMFSGDFIHKEELEKERKEKEEEIKKNLILTEKYNKLLEEKIEKQEQRIQGLPLHT